VDGVPEGVGVGVEDPPPPQADNARLPAIAQALKDAVFEMVCEVLVLVVFITVQGVYEVFKFSCMYELLFCRV
jgi:hypothetical protein